MYQMQMYTTKNIIDKKNTPHLHLSKNLHNNFIIDSFDHSFILFIETEQRCYFL